MAAAAVAILLGWCFFRIKASFASIAEYYVFREVGDFSGTPASHRISNQISSARLLACAG